MNTTTRYAITLSLGRYKAHATESITTPTSDYVVELVKEPETMYRDTPCHGMVYYKGKATDFEINGWTFSQVFDGDIHSSFSQQYVFMETSCITPDGDDYDVKVKLDAYHSPQQLVELYIDIIHIISQCKSIDEFENFEKNFEGIVIAMRYSSKEIYDYEIEYKNAINAIIKNTEGDSTRKHLNMYCKRLLKSYEETLKARLSKAQ